EAMNRTIFVGVCAAGWLMCATVVPSAAQQNAGQAQLHVTVVDQTGAAIANATIRVSGDGVTPVMRQVDARGQTNFDMLAIGPVQIHVESAGFTPADATIVLRRGNNTQIITLTIAGLQEQVVVNEDTSIEDRSGNSMTTTLDEDDIAGLPDDPDE